tara:strand:- start:159 stop:821 length:663 start_codon:yes stop_codon:yes gene_type:complete
MYFKLLPEIQYDSKPIKYPFSESDYVIAKNFFRRFKISDEYYSNAVYFKKYQVSDFEQPWMIANTFYGAPKMDWIILITNNIINPIFDWPQDGYILRKRLEASYDNPYAEIQQYEVTSADSQIAIHGKVIHEPGLVVDKRFMDSNIKFLDNNQVIQTVGANTIVKPVTVFEYQERLNEKRREISILKERFVEPFKNEFRKANKYSDSTDTISTRIKKTGI